MKADIDKRYLILDPAIFRGEHIYAPNVLEAIDRVSALLNYRCDIRVKHVPRKGEGFLSLIP